MATLTLLDRMRQDMQLRGLAARTQKSYLEVVGSVATFCGRPPNALDTLTEDELRQFLRRFLQHVLPPGFHKVRYYGFWAPAAQATRTRVQQSLASVAAPVAPAAPNAPTADAQPAAPTPPVVPCPHCAAGVLRLARRLAPCRGANAIPP